VFGLRRVDAEESNMFATVIDDNDQCVAVDHVVDKRAAWRGGGARCCDYREYKGGEGNSGDGV
jgi:hypothetical protein